MNNPFTEKLMQKDLEIQLLKEERDRYKRGLEEVCKMYKETNKPVLDHWGMIALAKYVLDLNNDY